MNTTTTIRLSTYKLFYETFGDALQLEASLARYTSARVGGTAEMFLTVTDAAALQQALELAYNQQLPYFILGGGSNILVSDKGVRGLVIMNRAKNVSFRHTGAHVICTVDAGTNLSSLARQCIGKGLGGLEWAVSVPGTVGGAVVGNSGAHGGDMAGTLRAATIWEPGRGVRIYNNHEMEYSYRNSILKQEHGRQISRRVVLSAELTLVPEATELLLARAEGFTAHRKQSQPGGATVGSMFKNPENYYAGYLIEAAGLKGYTVGGAHISEKHANFFVNRQDAKSEDIRALIAEAWNSVREKFDIEMDLEVELVGEWDFDA